MRVVSDNAGPCGFRNHDVTNTSHKSPVDFRRISESPFMNFGDRNERALTRALLFHVCRRLPPELEIEILGYLRQKHITSLIVKKAIDYYAELTSILNLFKERTLDFPLIGAGDSFDWWTQIVLIYNAAKAYAPDGFAKGFLDLFTSNMRRRIIFYAKGGARMFRFANDPTLGLSG